MSKIKNLMSFINDRFEINRKSFTDKELSGLDKTTCSVMTGRLLTKVSVLVMHKSRHTGTPLQRIHNKINLRYGLVRVLSTFGAVKQAGELSEDIVRSCYKYNIIDIGLHVSRVLVKKYSIFERDNRGLKRAIEMKEHFEYEHKIEMRAETLYCQYAVSRRSKPISLIAINEELGLLDSKNPKFNLFKYILSYTELDELNHHDKAAHVCRIAIDRFSKINYNNGIFIFSEKLAKSLMKSGDLKRAEWEIERTCNDLPDRTLSWVKNMSSLFLIKLKKGANKEAQDVLDKIRKCRNLKFFGLNMRDQLFINQTYLDIATGSIKWNKVKINMSRYESNDAIMALYVMKLIYTDNDARVNYSGVKNARTQEFIKLMLTLRKADSWYNWVRDSKKIYNKMQKVKDLDQIEIISYEDLWPQIADFALSQNRRYNLYKKATNPAVELAGI